MPRNLWFFTPILPFPFMTVGKGQSRNSTSHRQCCWGNNISRAPCTHVDVFGLGMASGVSPHPGHPLPPRLRWQPQAPPPPRRVLAPARTLPPRAACRAHTSHADTLIAVHARLSSPRRDAASPLRACTCCAQSAPPGLSDPCPWSACPQLRGCVWTWCTGHKYSPSAPLGSQLRAKSPWHRCTPNLCPCTCGTGVHRPCPSVHPRPSAKNARRLLPQPAAGWYYIKRASEDCFGRVLELQGSFGGLDSAWPHVGSCTGPLIRAKGSGMSRDGAGGGEALWSQGVEASRWRLSGDISSGSGLVIPFCNSVALWKHSVILPRGEARGTLKARFDS